MKPDQTYWTWTTCCRLTACYAVFLLAPAAGTSGQEILTRERQLQQRLTERASINFEETPLEEALREIARSQAVQIWLDRNSLDVAQIDSNTPVTIRLTDVPLETALALMLREFDLRISLVDQVVVVQTMEEAEARPMRQVLDVGEFIRKDQPAKSASEILDVIQTTVEPETWEQNGGVGTLTYVHGQLVICNTYGVIRQIEQLLADLRTGMAKYSKDSRDELSGIIANRPWDRTIKKE